MKVLEAVNEIMTLYEMYGDKDYAGEPVSQLAHMCQCAQLAEAEGADDELVLAAFLHDIGHLCEFAFPGASLRHMDGFGIVDHEKLGSDYLLSLGFSVNLARLVGSHVNAKRYLIFKYPEYYDQLSAASKKTLEYQGGRMSEAEAMLFEKDILLEKYISLRRWDERAKIQHKPLAPLEHFRQMMTEHLSLQNS
jgi:2-amino-1-hydroxyethylphosphonate dioxygenase (glycine-forming)